MLSVTYALIACDRARSAEKLRKVSCTSDSRELLQTPSTSNDDDEEGKDDDDDEAAARLL